MTTALEAGPQVVLVRYGELALKGNNRAMFERHLLDNMRTALANLAEVKIERIQGRVAVTPDRRIEAVARRLQDVFGISSVSPACAAPRELEALVEVARRVLREAVDELPPERETTFRVATRRADKSFALTSAELDRHVADALLGEFPSLKVKLEHPELALEIDVRPERAYVFARRLPGPGGLPVGTQGKAVCLISGGIDSPVAAWMAMKRGCAVEFVTFHSHPFIGDAAKKKVIDLVRILARFQPESVLHVVPFAEAQVAIRDAGHPGYRTVLYRRMMQRIATRLARSAGAKALVTGEALGQVASQTIENITCIGDAAGLPVLQPLIGFDKQETIELARRIGTYDLSAVQEPDCCTLFMPTRPIIRGRLEVCREIEARLDVDELAQSALAGAERFEIAPDA